MAALLKLPVPSAAAGLSFKDTGTQQGFTPASPSVFCTATPLQVSKHHIRFDAVDHIPVFLVLLQWRHQRFDACAIFIQLLHMLQEEINTVFLREVWQFRLEV